MKLTATVLLVIFVAVTGDGLKFFENFDVNVFNECLRDDPAIFVEIQDTIETTLSNPLIPEDNEKINKLFECLLLANHVDNLEFEKFKPQYTQMLSDKENFKPPDDLDQVFTTCKADLPDTLSTAAKFIKFHNCIIKNYLLEAASTS